MSKKLGLVGLVIVVLLIGASLVAAQSNLPGSGWKSGQQIQNVGSSNATIVFDAYSTDGNATNCSIPGSGPVAPGASVTFLTDIHCPVPAGFIGSAVVSADQPIAAIVNVNNRGTSSAAGQYRGTDGSDVSTSIAFPLVKNAYSGRTTTFYVQNASASANNITATFRVGATTYTLNKPNVPGNAMVVISPADATPPVPAGAVGSLTVTGTQPLAGTSLEHEASAAVAQNLQASKAFTPSDYDTTAYCPLVRNGHTANNQTTGIQVQNVSGSAQKVKVDYAYQVGGGAAQAKSVESPNALAPNESFTFFGGDPLLGLPANAVGSATVSGLGGGDVAVVVNDRGFASVNPNRVTTYTCFAKSSTTGEIVLPLYKEYNGGNTTGIQVQNVGAAPAVATITYTPSVGTPVVLATANPIPVGSSFTFFGVSGAQAGVTVVSGSAAALSNTVGGVKVSSAQPIVAIANESSIAGPTSAPSGQDTKNYEGFNQ